MKLRIVVSGEGNTAPSKAPEVSSRSVVKHVGHVSRLLNAESSW